MKRKENIRKSEVGRPKTEDKNAGMKKCRNAGMKENDVESQKLEDGRRKTGGGSAKRGQSGVKDSDPRLRNCGSESAAPIERNSTVFHKRLPPVIIDFLPEELAIRACDLLRFFNN